MSNNPKIQLNDLLRELSGAGLLITDWVKLSKRINVLFDCDLKTEIIINKKPEQVLLVIDGGVLQEIDSTSENIGFTLIDWDNIKGGGGESDLYELGEYTANLKTEQEILNEINDANQAVLDNNKFFEDNK